MKTIYLGIELGISSKTGLKSLPFQTANKIIDFTIMKIFTKKHQ